MIERLIRELSRAEAYPHRVDDVVVCQTHISVVFLAGEFAYKLKKPVDLGFVDYSTLARRRHFCEREIALNQRLAPGVYHDVVPVVTDEAQRLVLEKDSCDDAEVLEWAVQMKRLNDGDTLRARLAENRVPSKLMERLGQKLARFHQSARGGPDVDACASFEQVEKNCLDNFEQSRSHIGETVDAAVFERLRGLFRRHLDALEPLITDRSQRGVARDCHGDLRSEHVYIKDDDSLCIVDCIEFNDAFRFADPVCDIAFLAMDLEIRGHDEASHRLLDAYFDERSDDEEGRQLVDLYVAYRSCVRAKVRGFQASESEVSKGDRGRARRKARAHWNYALTRLEEPGQGPSLVMLAGLPASGKSTLGRRWLADDKIDLLLDSDRVRKELAGIDPDDDAPADFESGIYRPAFSDRTYEELAHRAQQALLKGLRVAVAATFVSDAKRRSMIALARSMGVPVHFLECQIPEEIARQRLASRSDDASDADIEIYERLRQRWEPPSPMVERVRKVCDTSR